MKPQLVAVTLIAALGAAACNSTEHVAGPIPVEYEMINLGTLGASQITYGHFDNQGRVLAYGQAADYELHIFRWADGVTTDLGAAPRLFGSIAFSPRGLAAGTNCSHDTDTCSFFLFDEGTVTTLETGGTAFENESRVALVLDDGTVVGVVQYGDRIAPVMWKGGIRIELPALDSLHPRTTPAAMNRRGQLIAQSLDSQTMQPRPYLWDTGVVRDLGGLFDRQCSEPALQCGTADVSAINDDGDIVGHSYNEQNHRAVIWRDGGPAADLGVFPGQYTTAWEINERGDIYGLGGPEHWWALIDDKLYLPGNPPGLLSHPNRMNERGEIVGFFHADGEIVRAFVWSKGRITDLGPGPPGSQRGEAIQINERGEVLGIYYGADQRQALVLWRPVNR